MSKNMKRAILAVIIISWFCASVQAAELRVPSQYPNIQAAMSAAVEGDSVVVADGNYTGTGFRDITNTFKGNKLIIRSENGPNNCILNCNGTSSSKHCAFNFRDYTKQNSIVIDGFKIINAYYRNDGAGAIYSSVLMDLEVINCVFVNNTGGAICTIGFRTFNSKNCLFSDGKYGGGVYCEPANNTLANPVFEDCVFSKNNSDFDGGGLYFWGNKKIAALLKNCKFIGNTTKNTKFGGGICIVEGPNSILTNCIFRENSAISGGGMYGSGTLINCEFVNNKASYSGGGMHGSGTLINCEFVNNKATRSDGGGMFGGGTFNNCTFVGNHSGISIGGGLAVPVFGNPIDSKMINCILWDNTVTRLYSVENAQISILIGAEMKIDYTCIQGWSGLLGGVGNMGLAPLFIDPCNPDPNLRNYRLQAGSPCINAGDPNFIAEANETDLDGNPRVIYGRVDMGTYEYVDKIPLANAGPDQVVYAYIDGFADVNLDGSDSNDSDGQPLTYKWTWTIDGNTYEASGVKPKIELLVGMHTIELVVNDGYENSLPDYVDVNVVGPVKAMVKIMPQAINLSSNGNWIKATMVLPEGFKVDDVDANVPLVIEPMGVRSKNSAWAKAHPTDYIEVMFDRGELCSSLNNGEQELSVVGQFKTGQYFYGSDVIKVIGKRK